ncbi:ribonuclease H-like domain-containing protein, partial [Tanacetum coccineum]
LLLQFYFSRLYKEFDMTDLGALNYFLGISAVRHPTWLFLSQKKYARQLLERAHMVNCNPSRTPIDTDSKLGSDGVPVQDHTLYPQRNTGVLLMLLAWIRNLLRELYSPLLTATLVYCDKYADIFTKGLPSALFEDFRSSLSIQPLPAPTAGAY